METRKSKAQRSSAAPARTGKHKTKARQPKKSKATSKGQPLPLEDPPPEPEQLTHNFGTCSQHVRMLMDKTGKKGYSEMFVDKDNRELMKQDILSLSRMGVTLRSWKHRLFQLFAHKWQHEERVIARFSKEYLEGVATNWTTADTEPGLPDQNQAEESHNRVYKIECTHYDRLPLIPFVQRHMKYMGAKPFTKAKFATQGHIDKKMWVQAQEALRDTRQYEATHTMDIDVTFSPFHPPKKVPCIFILSTRQVLPIAITHGGDVETLKEHARPIINNLVLLYEGGKGHIKHLDDFFSATDRARMLYPLVRDGSATSHACTCPPYQLHEVCVHSLAYDIKHNKLEIPEDYRLDVIECVAKRGRRKARKGGAYDNDDVPKFTLPEEA